jgi:anti-sigma regulatory factor (Ser/Thr protein kinase)
MVEQGPCLGEWRFVAVPGRVPWLRNQVRDALADVGVDLESVALAVTEAITNIVRHAYPDRWGEALVTASLEERQVVVSVRDFGVGSEGFFAGSNRGMGLGLRLMQATAEEFQVEPGATGTSVVMRFAVES